MGALVIAELRSARTAWCAVILAFIATSFAIILPLLALAAIEDTIATGIIPAMEMPALRFLPIWNLALALLAALNIISAVTGLVVESRRGSLARLALAGATPGQVSRILLAQLAIVAGVGAVIGGVLAIVAVPAAVALTVGDRGIDQSLVAARPDLGLALAGLAGFIVLAMVAGLRQSRVAAAVPAVEALRTVPGASVRRRRVGRWIGAFLLALLIAGIAASTFVMAPQLGVDSGDVVLQSSLICMLLTGSLLSMCAPLTVGLLTRAWTALVPSRSAAWVLARASVIAKGERLARTVTPIMFSIGVLFGLGMLILSTSALLTSMGRDGFEQAGISSLLIFVGMVLLVAFAGGVSVLLMMSRQREAELALAGVVGATTRQQVLMSVFEGLIITGTAAVLGLAMSGIGMTVFVVGMGSLGLMAPVVVPWHVLAAVLLVGALIIVAATTLPVLPSLRRPARTVVAQLAAE